MFYSYSAAGDSVEILLEYSTKLLELFQYSWEMLPLMYVILKDAGSNLEEAVRRIVEGNANLNILPTKLYTLFLLKFLVLFSKQIDYSTNENN